MLYDGSKLAKYIFFLNAYLATLPSTTSEVVPQKKNSSPPHHVSHCTQSLQFLGWCGDVHGRFPSMFLANVALLVTGVVLPFCRTFASFCSMRFVSGLAYDSSLQIFYLLVRKWAELPKFCVCVVIKVTLPPPSPPFLPDGTF